MKIEFRDGDDWQELLVDGKVIEANHSFPPDVWLGLLKKLGAKVTQPTGGFCKWCTEWVKGLEPGSACEKCAKEVDD